MIRVGIRELRQNASALIRRVKAGEVLEVTERGQPVARLVPIGDEEDLVERLIREGAAVRPRGSLNDLPPPKPPRKGAPLPSEVLAEMRADER